MTQFYWVFRIIIQKEKYPPEGKTWEDCFKDPTIKMKNQACIYYHFNFDVRLSWTSKENVTIYWNSPFSIEEKQIENEMYIPQNLTRNNCIKSIKLVKS